MENIENAIKKVLECAKIFGSEGLQSLLYTLITGCNLEESLKILSSASKLNIADARDIILGLKEAYESQKSYPGTYIYNPIYPYTYPDSSDPYKPPYIFSSNKAKEYTVSQEPGYVQTTTTGDQVIYHQQ